MVTVMTVRELKDELRSRGLSTSGLKEVLVERLRVSDWNMGEGPVKALIGAWCMLDNLVSWYVGRSLWGCLWHVRWTRCKVPSTHLRAPGLSLPLCLSAPASLKSI